MVNFCTCPDANCTYHPTNHGQGCTPCIGKNLKSGEIPSCFFDLIEGAESRSEGSFKTFAEIVLSNLHALH